MLVPACQVPCILYESWESREDQVQHARKALSKFACAGCHSMLRVSGQDVHRELTVCMSGSKSEGDLAVLFGKLDGARMQDTI